MDIPLLILLAGVSLTGKSTLAYFLQEHLTPINEDMEEDPSVKIISTNSVLKIMRKHISKEDEPILHLPVYQCGNFISTKSEYSPIDTIYGCLEQSERVQQYLEAMIENSFKKGKTVIVEGVHLNHKFNAKLIEKYGT